MELQSGSPTVQTILVKIIVHMDGENTENTNKDLNKFCKDNLLKMFRNDEGLYYHELTHSHYQILCSYFTYLHFIVI
jgi:hypothetical protein